MLLLVVTSAPLIIRFLNVEQLERFYKVVILGRSGAGLSCIEPVAYRQRFLSRMEELVAPGYNSEA